MNGSAPPSLLLIGGGHANVQILESLRRDRWPTIRVTLVSPESSTLYSGMVPGYLQGTYTESDISIDLEALCRSADAAFLKASAECVDVANRSIDTTSGKVGWDMLSIDIGSIAAGSDLPGVRDYALGVRPLSKALLLRRALDEAIRQAAAESSTLKVAIVGAGAAGVEVALAFDRRIREAGVRPHIVLLEGSTEILGEFGVRSRSIARQILRKREIEITAGQQVRSVGPKGVHLAESVIEADLVVWTTGAAAPPLPAESELPVDAEGYLLVDRTLRVVSGEPIWGAGDCVSILGEDIPKAGVFAVREAETLASNLLAYLHDVGPEQYRPQRRYLSLLNTADGKALLSRGSFALYGRPAWWLKDWIDRRWMNRFSKGDEIVK